MNAGGEAKEPADAVDGIGYRNKKATVSSLEALWFYRGMLPHHSGHDEERAAAKTVRWALMLPPPGSHFNPVKPYFSLFFGVFARIYFDDV